MCFYYCILKKKKVYYKCSEVGTLKKRKVKKMEALYNVCYLSRKNNLSEANVSIQAHNVLDAVVKFCSDAELHEDSFRVKSLNFVRLVDTGEVF